MNNSSRYISPKSLKHFECDDLKWYNLDTSRKVSTLKDRIPVTNPRITATNIKTLYRFLLLNRLLIKDLTAPPSTIQQLKDLEDNQKKIANLSSGDLDSFSLDELNSLPIFSFKQMWLKGRILKVIDGDTVDVALSIGIDKLSCASGSQLCLILGKGEKELIIKLRLRLYGIDTAEKDTMEGQVIKKYSEKLYAETENKVEVLMLDTGARGRTLAVIYGRHGKDKNNITDTTINNRILLYKPDDHTLGKLAVPYYGQTKDSDFRKSHHLLKSST